MEQQLENGIGVWTFQVGDALYGVAAQSEERAMECFGQHAPVYTEIIMTRCADLEHKVITSIDPDGDQRWLSFREMIRKTAEIHGPDAFPRLLVSCEP